MEKGETRFNTTFQKGFNQCFTKDWIAYMYFQSN